MNLKINLTVKHLSLSVLLFSSLVNASDSSEKHKGLFKPLPKIAESQTNPVTKEKVILGEKLYHDTILSLNNDLSCNSCHKIDSFGVDGEKTSPGTDGQFGDRNSPTVFNAALHIAQFWDGRAKDVEEQALGPILNPVEMAIPSEEEVIKRLSNHDKYPQMFKEAFPKEGNPVTYQNVGNAIGAFERTLLTPSRFDDYLKGNESALSDKEKKGLNLFVETGCAICHNGVGIGGGMYQKIGLVHPFETKDLGRYEHTKSEHEKFFFKVPSLRNVEHTAPYYHDGSIKTLDEAIENMAWHQLGKKLKPDEIDLIKSFLKSLTGELQEVDLESLPSSKDHY